MSQSERLFDLKRQLHYIEMRVAFMQEEIELIHKEIANITKDEQPDNTNIAKSED